MVSYPQALAIVLVFLTGAAAGVFAALQLVAFSLSRKSGIRTMLRFMSSEPDFVVTLLEVVQEELDDQNPNVRKDRPREIDPR